VHHLELGDIGVEVDDPEARFRVEFGHGARVVGDDWDDDRRYDRISRWGHQPVTRG
jgi:hypothetical protein